MRISGHFEGKWFVYSFIATYQDTNSVGNVYFGMYGLFVGKTRELFFNKVMPDFDLKTTKFFILTRSFEHKFVREAREFDVITVKIRVADFNRKFCTLEHQIFGSENELLGKGKQSLLFVSSKDYSLLDIPSGGLHRVHAAHLRPAAQIFRQRLVVHSAEFEHLEDRLLDQVVRAGRAGGDADGDRVVVGKQLGVVRGDLLAAWRS